MWFCTIVLLACDVCGIIPLSCCNQKTNKTNIPLSKNTQIRIQHTIIAIITTDSDDSNDTNDMKF